MLFKTIKAATLHVIMSFLNSSHSGQTHDCSRHMTEHTTNSLGFTSRSYNCLKTAIMEECKPAATKDCKLVTEDSKLIRAVACEVFSSDTHFSVLTTVSLLTDLYASYSLARFLPLLFSFARFWAFSHCVVEAFAVLGCYAR
jgi:hypothetical protein